MRWAQQPQGVANPKKAVSRTLVCALLMGLTGAVARLGLGA